MNHAALDNLGNEEIYRGEEEDVLSVLASAREAFEQLLRTIKGRVDTNSDDNGIRLMLYVDEAHTLVEVLLDKDGKTLYAPPSMCFYAVPYLQSFSRLHLISDGLLHQRFWPDLLKFGNPLSQSKLP